MATGECVVFALARRGERTDAVELSVGVELIATACQDFMTIGLMSHVPHNAVVGGAEHIVEGYGEFHNAQARSEMPWVVGHFLNDVGAQFFAHGGKFLNA